MYCVICSMISCVVLNNFFLPLMSFADLLLLKCGYPHSSIYNYSRLMYVMLSVCVGSWWLWSLPATDQEAGSGTYC